MPSLFSREISHPAFQLAEGREGEIHNSLSKNLGSENVKTILSGG